MPSNNISCFYYPAKVIFLDDNANFRQMLELNFIDKLNMSLFDKPDKAIEYIKTHDFSPKKNIIHSVSNELSDTTTDALVDVEFEKIHQLIYDEKRFDTLSVLVVDYSMPAKNGLEVCEELKHLPIKKILLTAEADLETAVGAFNDRIIDKFILKSDKDLYDKLEEAIDLLRQEYFIGQSVSIMDSAGSDLKDLFINENFQHLFYETEHKAQSVEFYLLDVFGSFLFLDGKQNPTWLIMRPKHSLDQYVELAEGYDASKKIIESLRGYQKTSFFLTKEDMRTPVEQWEKYLVDIRPFDNYYYFTVIGDKTQNHIQWDNIKSIDL